MIGIKNVYFNDTLLLLLNELESQRSGHSPIIVGYEAPAIK